VIVALIQIESLGSHSLVEEQVGDINRAPAEEACSCGQVDEPVENNGSSTGHGHEGEKRSRGRDQDRVDGQSLLGAVSQESGTLSSQGKAVQDTTEQKRKEFPAEKAEVKMAALTTEGRPLIPARVMAMTKGDWEMGFVVERRSGEL